MLPRRPLEDPTDRSRASPEAPAGQPADPYHDRVADRRGTIREPASRQQGEVVTTRRRDHRSSRSRLLIALGLVLLLTVAVLLFVRPWDGAEKRSTPPAVSPPVSPDAPLDARGRPYRPFHDQSWWNTP